MPDYQNFLDGAGKALETVPELYEDGLQETVQETGKLISRIPRAINAAFCGIDRWILNKEYNVAETKNLLEEKLKNVLPEKIVAPEAYVAVPALQAISYSMDSDELRNMYANLLAKAMVIDTKDSVHPAFVDMIRQMSPLDARVFKLLTGVRARPIINLQLELLGRSGVFTTEKSCITWIDIASIDDVCKSIDNFERCGLIRIPEDDYYVVKSQYDIIRTAKHFIDYKNSILSTMDKSIFNLTEKESQINITDIGRAFYDVCINDNIN